MTNLRADRMGVGDLVAQTPADRDRYVDFLRGASILAVMLGHWLVAVVERDGPHAVGTNALSTVTWLHGATWLMQVMPVFFFVGGFSNLRAIEHGRIAGGTWRAYLQRRVERLLRPTLVFAGLWLLAAAALGAVGADRVSVHLAARIASQPLWFLAVYLVVVALAPPMLVLHRRAPAVTVAGLLALMTALDVARLGFGQDGPAMANYVFVFLLAQQIGFAYGDGRLTRLPARVLLGASAASFASLLALTAFGPYPVSMVGVPGEALSNMSPPTICIAVLTVGQVGVLMALRPSANRWLARRRPWTVTVAVNARIMTLFLWHLSALAVAALVLLEVGIPTPDPGTWAWWGLRPVWLLAATVVLAALVAAFGRVETPSAAAPVPSGRSNWLAVVGVVAVVRGLIGLALSGFDRVLEAHGKPFLGFRLSPLGAAVLVALGWLLIRGHRPPRARSGAAAAPAAETRAEPTGSGPAVPRPDASS